MTSPKNYQRYASQWMALFDAFKENPQQVHVVHCPSDKKARALRSEFYKAREAFLDDPDMRDEYGAVLNSREVKVDGPNNREVIFDSKDNNWVAQLLGASLKSKGDGQDNGKESNSDVSGDKE